MPFIGYLVGSVMLNDVEWIIPQIALLLLGYLGIKTIIESFKDEDHKHIESLTINILLVQAIATSIDALSAGFTISNYTITEVLVCVCIIAIMTSLICIIGEYVGRKIGTKLGRKAELIGGIILLGISIEIFISGMIE